MGYKKSFNLVTLQLIIPLSTMTKAEYKATYGIDLDDIDIEKVTLLQEDGSKNKYFVDEVKTTENGVNIYAGGKVLSIGSSVSVVNNAYSVINSKPIYCHPITLYLHAAQKLFKFAMLIFNNSENPIDTVGKLKSLLLSFTGRVLVSGAYYVPEYYMAPAFIYSDGEHLMLIGIDSAGNIHDDSSNPIDFIDLIETTGVGISDPVNKIN